VGFKPVQILYGGGTVYLVGIDISKFKHDCFIITNHGEVIIDSFSFKNDRDGFISFLKVITSLDQSLEIRIGLEATGHYGNNLKDFLFSNGLDFVEFNPYLTKKFSDAHSLRKTKTDKIDAKVIAHMLTFVDYKAYTMDYTMVKLKSLTRLHSRLVKNHSYFLVQLTNVLDNVFPEFKPFFEHKFSKTSLFILKKYKLPSVIAKLDHYKDFEELRKLSRGSFNYSKFDKLVYLAKNTIGSSDESDIIQIDIIIDLIDSLESKLNSLEKIINETVVKLDPPTLSIKGIGKLSAAVIIAEFGNFNNFDSDAKLVSFAGMDVSISQSGNKSSSGRLVKRGSKYLRQTLMNLIPGLLLHNPTLFRLYYKKRREGKLHRAASAHVVRKLLRIIYFLETNNIKYDPSKCR